MMAVQPMVARCGRTVATLVGLLAAAACQPSSSGRLMPERQPGVELDRQAVDGDVAILRTPGLTVRIFGFWSSRGGQQLYVTYRNTGTADARINAARFTIFREVDGRAIGSAELLRVSDVTGRANADGTVDVAGAPVLFDADATGKSSGALALPVGGSRSVAVSFARLPGDPPPQAGDKVDAGLPLAGTNGADLHFRAGTD